MILRLVIRGAQREHAATDTTGTQHILKPGRAHYWMLLVCGVFFILVGITVVITSRPFWKLGLVFGPFFAVPGILALYALRRSVALTIDGIRSCSPWTGERYVLWKDIEAVRFRKWGQTIRVRVSGSDQIVVPCYMSGMAELERYMRAHLSPNVLGSTFEDYAAYAASL